MESSRIGYVRPISIRRILAWFIATILALGFVLWVWSVEARLHDALKKVEEAHARWHAKAHATEPASELAPTTAYDVPLVPHPHFNINPSFIQHGVGMDIDIVPTPNHPWVRTVKLPLARSAAKRPAVATPNAL